jgi:hypothetical protein
MGLEMKVMCLFQMSLAAHLVRGALLLWHGTLSDARKKVSSFRGKMASL